MNDPSHTFKKKLVVAFCLLLTPVLAMDFTAIESFGFFPLKSAEAVRGRPASPTSVAGVKRRTRHRTAHRVSTAKRLYRLPAGCKTVVTRGVTYHKCGSVHYRPYFEGNRVVYVQASP